LVRDKAAQTNFSYLAVSIIVVKPLHELALEFPVWHVFSVSDSRELLAQKGFCFLNFLSAALAETINPDQKPVFRCHTHRLSHPTVLG
jgi:hypothetical protein